MTAAGLEKILDKEEASSLEVRKFAHAFSLTAVAGILSPRPMQARAGILLTIDAPGVQSSTVSGVTTETFDSRTPGIMTSYSSTIGQYSGQFAIVGPNGLWRSE